MKLEYLSIFFEQIKNSNVYNENIDMKYLTILGIVILFSSLKEIEIVKLTLRNDSSKSIYLEIPGVMNPNLSPMSNSGVSFKVGQKVYFFVDKKRYLLFEATKEMDGATLIVDELIKQRKEELNL